MSEVVEFPEEHRLKQLSAACDAMLVDTRGAVEAMLEEIAATRFRLDAAIIKLSGPYDELGSIEVTEIERRLRMASTLLQCATEQLGAARDRSWWVGLTEVQ